MSTDQIELPDVEGMTHRALDVGGLSIHVAEAGSGPPVLLLHGWPQHWYAWRKVAPRLAVDHRVICPDLRGFGWSDAPAGRYDKATLARDILALLDALELDRVELIAHDWGAWIGFILCLENPQRFEHYLALNMYTPWPEAPSPRAIPTMARLWYQVAIATPGLGQGLIRHTPFDAQAHHRRRGAPGVDRRRAEALQRVAAGAGARRGLGPAVSARSSFTSCGSFLRGQFNGRRLSVPRSCSTEPATSPSTDRALGRWQLHADQMEVELREDSGHFIAEELPDVVVARARALFGRSPRPDAERHGPMNLSAKT